MKRLLPILFLALSLLWPRNIAAQKISRLSSFKPMLDTVSAHMRKRNTVKIYLSLASVIKKDNSLDFNFKRTLGDYPWRERDPEWFRSELKKWLPSQYADCSIGAVMCNGLPLEDFVMPEPGNDGKPVSDRFRTDDPRRIDPAFIVRQGSKRFNKGLSGRIIALWQSHGRYFNAKEGKWLWQRGALLRTVEDMYTQSYVLPFLMPMLENAGAYTMTPRERDIQRYEVITDNDPAFEGAREGLTRRRGVYSETGQWNGAGTGFADLKEIYSGDDNPFTMGTARVAACTEGGVPTATAVWRPEIPERGFYAVYVSWKSLPNSSSFARYTVRHLGGETVFLVNQKMGGGTWIYLGTFEFEKGWNGEVTLDNATPEGKRFRSGSVVSADAVKIGGGMGKIARGSAPVPDSTYVTSGMPSFAEGSHYWMQWAGVDTTVTRLHDNDYGNDYGNRGAWVGMMSGGSRTNPEYEGNGKKIPVDLSLAFHSDAGLTPNDSTIGTLAIYTLLSDGKTKFPNGEDRMQSRLLADFVQTEVVKAVRADYNSNWQRRQIWDRSYSECRTTTVPGILLELLSHQNFADMKLGLDPSFRFDVSRAVYKGILKFLSDRYGCSYAVQPLPVNSFQVTFASSPVAGSPAKVCLSWKPTQDGLEKTAAPTGYILYTRVDGGGFDQGREVELQTLAGRRTGTETTIEPGHVYDFRIVAYNDGGLSFPSETLSVGIPEKENKGPEGQAVMIVNNFDRVAPPAWFDTPEYAGFNDELDSGVPYLYGIDFIGSQHVFKRDEQWQSDDNPGFGASHSDQAGKIVAGNTFDYPSIHGRALIGIGYPFYSVSNEAFMDDLSCQSYAWMADIICGKQVSTPLGDGKPGLRYKVFPQGMRKALTEFTAKGRSILLSGADIGTDVWDGVYPIEKDSVETEETIRFVQNTLGYKWLTNSPTKSGEAVPVKSSGIRPKGLSGPIKYRTSPNPYTYCVESADGILPSSEGASPVLTYSDTGICAGVLFEAPGYKAISIGFPLEIIEGKTNFAALMEALLDCLKNKGERP